MTQVDLNKLDADQLRNLVAQLMGSAADQEQQLQTLQQRTVTAEQRNRPRTVDQYRRQLKRHFSFGQRQIADITTPESVASSE